MEKNAVTKHLAEQFVSLQQQALTARHGIWLFISTECLFFAPMFLAYIVYRIVYPEAAIEGSRSLDLFFGSLNTGLLLTSSLTMTLAVHAAREGKRKALMWFLLITALLGIGFLGVKALEYRSDILNNVVPGRTMNAEGHRLMRPTHLFLFIYFALTGLHALHLFVGVVIILMIASQAYQGAYSKQYHHPVEITSLYWHFVDSIWVMLYPLLYLMGRGGAS